MIKKAFAIGIVSTFLVMFGCAPVVVKVNVAYIPSKEATKPQITTSKRIRIEPIVDKRWNMTLGEIRDRGKTIGMYTSNTDVPTVITDAIKVELTNQGYQVVSEGGDLVLSGVLLGLNGKRRQGWFLRGDFEASAQVGMILKDAMRGNVIWSDVVRGRSELKYGPLTKPNERFVETINSAIKDLIERLIDLESFRSALLDGEMAKSLPVVTSMTVAQFSNQYSCNSPPF